MLTKTNADEIQSYLADSSNMRGGHAARVVFPENSSEVASVLAQATREGTPVTVAGAGTGIVGGRVPFGGVVLATDRLNQITEITREGNGGRAVAGAGVVLADFQREVGARGLVYPPDPTEWSCFLGGTVATNASGARTFKYGPTRNFIRRLEVALPAGDVINLERGRLRADENGVMRIPLPGGRNIEAHLPSYTMPRTRKHASAYYVAPGLDAVDLFIGSEGTLGVVTEIEVKLLPRPEGVLAGLVFFGTEEDLLAFVAEARALSSATRRENKAGGLDALALEFFDGESLAFLRGRYKRVPITAAGAIFFEQETGEQTEEKLFAEWLALLERHRALEEDSWFALNEHDRREMREFRHQLPVLVNEWLVRHNQRKVSTDMAVPDAEFAGMLGFYQERLRGSRLQYVIFGHIGDNHVHVNILPRDREEAERARAVYTEFVRRAVSVGGTISAEHGIGKLKRDYLRFLYDEKHLREMAALKRAFDPARILGRGNIFAEDYLT
ncbi:MAG TPA: FAD-linked oxidase C-terminal domain-containing protein [Pyrinomonadaceae bacterium]|jgi:D-lactate dehydrogenase (cytochrome)